MCVLIIMTLIPVKTDSCMRLTFWRKDVLLPGYVDWFQLGKEDSVSNVLFSAISFPLFFFLSLPGLSAGSDSATIASAAAWKPLDHSSSSTSTRCQSIAGGSGQGSELASTQQHSKQFGDAFHPHMWYQLQAGLDAHAYRQRLISDGPCIC